MDLSDTTSSPQGAGFEPAWLRFVACGLAVGLGTFAVAWVIGAGRAPAAVATAVLFYAAALALAAYGFRRLYRHRQVGLCNLVTLLRLGLTSALVGMLASQDPAMSHGLAIATLAFALDGADGWLARRAGLCSDFGARFDMEVDSAFALILAALAVKAGLNPLILLLGLPRYAFWLASAVIPALNRPLPERFSRKVVCVVQIAVLLFLLVPGIAQELHYAAAITAGALVLWSFALDISALRQARR